MLSTRKDQNMSSDKVKKKPSLALNELSVEEIYDRYNTACNSISEGSTYEVKAKSISKNAVKIYNHDLGLEMVMTKALFLKYILGEQWLSSTLKREYEKEFLNLFNNNQVQMDLVAIFKSEEQVKIVEGFEVGKLTNFSFTLSFDPLSMENVVLSIEDQALLEGINRKSVFYHKLKEDLNLNQSMKKDLPIIFRKLQELKTKNTLLQKELQATEQKIGSTRGRSKNFFTKLLFFIKSFVNGPNTP